MRTNRASTTAEAAALVRALESTRSGGSNLFRDEYAEKFLSKHYQVLVRLCAMQPIQRVVEKIIDRKYPGAVADFVCRTRFIDDAIERGIASGAGRVVIVGAGYDTRSFRLGKSRDLQFVEIDHPDTQTLKLKRARGVIARELLDRVQFIPHDLSQPSLPALSKAPSIFILEGLTGYLPKASIDSLFDWMREMSAPGSMVVFTYIDQRFLEGHYTERPEQVLRKYLQRVGEPFHFGWRPEELGRYCSERGFTLKENCGYPEFQDRYLTPLNRKLHIYEFGNIAIAIRD
jgi:methyltransferase (TIGR00027 family)